MLKTSNETNLRFKMQKYSHKIMHTWNCKHTTHQQLTAVVLYQRHRTSPTTTTSLPQTDFKTVLCINSLPKVRLCLRRGVASIYKSASDILKYVHDRVLSLLWRGKTILLHPFFVPETSFSLSGKAWWERDLRHWRMSPFFSPLPFPSIVVCFICFLMFLSE